MVDSVRELVVVVEDDRSQRVVYEQWLGEAGYDVRAFENGESFLDELAILAPGAVFLDLHLPGIDGIEVLSRLRKRFRYLPVVLLTSDADVTMVVSAIKLGAFDYLVKPIDREKFATEVRNAVAHGRMSLRVVQLQREVDGEGFPGIIGRSPVMMKMYRQLDRLGASDITILICGESGSGKELAARAIHENSGRNQGPFVAVNCAAIPEGLLESEFFGHEKGAFTGASHRRVGRLEEADGGTLLLDEIAELDPSLQAKLLRCLEDRRFRPVGGSREIASDFRLIAATHRNLDQEVAAGRFREDLFYRVAVFELEVPPLRERGDDVPLLANHFVDSSFSGDVPPDFSKDALALLKDYPWPGNVRELENAVQHAMLVCDGSVINATDFPARITEYLPEDGRNLAEKPDRPEIPAGEVARKGDDEPVVTLEEMERVTIEKAIRKTGGNLSEVSRLLDVSRATLYRKLVKYGIETDS